MKLNTNRWILRFGILAGCGWIAFTGCDSTNRPEAKTTSPGSTHVVHLTEATWETEVIQSKIPVLVDFTAKWCPPCQQLAPSIDKLADKYQGKVKVAKFDIGERSAPKGQKLMDEYRIHGIPAILVFKNGKLQNRSGDNGTDAAEVEQLIAQVLR